MKIYTFYTETHKELYENYFLESFSKYLSNDFEMIAHFGTQKTKTGDFTDPEMGNQMDEKISLIISGIKQNIGKWIIYADCDIQFFSNLMDDIESKIKDGDIDIFCQEDFGTICAGFLIIKCTQKTYDFFNFISSNRSKFANDQIAINYFRNLIKWSLLPRDKYFTVGNYNSAQVWKPGVPLFVPKNAILHHANYTISVKNKIILLEEVKKIRIYDNKQ